jgi:hypothetical protein
MEVEFQDRLPGPEDMAIIGLIDLADNNRFQPVAETRAWNFQQGAMAQWAPLAPDRLIIYNDRDSDRFISVLLDIKNRERRILPLPVCAISPYGQYALSVNFSRIRYNYAGVSDPYHDEPIPNDDGIYLMDLTTGEYRLILTYTQVAAFHFNNAMEYGKHWIEHLMINPDSSRFLFLHRFPLPDGGFCTRLLTANMDGSELFLLSDGMVSHMCWRNSRQILAWARRPSLITRARQRGIFANPLSRWALNWARHHERGWIRQHVIGDSFLLFTDLSQQVEPVVVGILTEDGHCSLSPNGQWILTDTYPDENHYRTLILYNYEKNIRRDIGKFYSLPNKKYGIDENWDISGMRCDLHPRWSRDGQKVCIDSVHEGSRQIYIFDVTDIVMRR